METLWELWVIMRKHQLKRWILSIRYLHSGSQPSFLLCFYSRFGPWSDITSPNSLLFILHFIHAMSWGDFFPHSFLFKCLASQIALTVNVRSAAICVIHQGAFQKRRRQNEKKKIKPWWKLFQISSHFFPPVLSMWPIALACCKTSKDLFLKGQ